VTANISADQETLIIDTDVGQTSGQARIKYHGDSRPAFVFFRRMGQALWKGPIDLQQKAIDEGKTAAEIADAKEFGDFKSESMAPGNVFQYGILPSGVDLDTIDPTRQVVSDGRFADIVTIFALLKRSGEPNFISDQGSTTGGTFRFRQFATGSTKTVVVMKVGRGVPFQDEFKIWRLSKVEHTLISPPGLNHPLEATPLWPGQLYAATVRISNDQGQWQSFHELFVTLRRKVDVTFSKLKIINDGDPFALGEADFTFEVAEGNLGVVKTMTRPIEDINDENPFDEISLSGFSHSIGPKSITEDNQKIAVRVSGHEHDGFLEPDELASSSLRDLEIPTGMGKENVTGKTTSVSAPSTTNADFTFSATVTHSVTYS